MTLVDDYAHLPDRGRGDDRAPHAKASGAGSSRLPAAPLHAHRAAVARLRRRLRRTPTSSCSPTCTRRERRRSPASRVGSCCARSSTRTRTPVTYLPRHADVVAHALATRPARRRRAHPRCGRPHDVPDEWLAASPPGRSAMTPDQRSGLADRGSTSSPTSSRGRCPGQVDARSAALRSSTTYRLGGPVASLVRVRDDDDARRGRRARSVRTRPPVLVVGPRLEPPRRRRRVRRASAVVLRATFEELDGRCRRGEVRAGGAVPLPVLARRAPPPGSGGLEFLVGIPGSVGGAVRMNAGGHGRETRDVLVDGAGASTLLRRAGRGRDRRSSATLDARRTATRTSIGAGCRRRRRASRGTPDAPRRVRGAASTRSCAGGASTSRAARTPGRCSATRRTTPPAGSSTRQAARGCASAARSCRRSTRTSSRPTAARPPATCVGWSTRSSAARRRADRRPARARAAMVGFDDRPSARAPMRRGRPIVSARAPAPSRRRASPGRRRPPVARPRRPGAAGPPPEGEGDRPADRALGVSRSR